MPTSTQSTGEQPLSLRLLLACGAIGPLLFIVTFLIEEATRPNYSPLRHYISSLSLGELGWIQIASFLITGVLLLCFALGLRRVLYPGIGSTWGPILLAIFALCHIGAGLFVIDPLLGYPPGAPNTLFPSAPTFHGVVHIALSLIGFSALPAACFVLARRFAHDPAWHGWVFYSIATGILIILFFILGSLVVPLAGLWQRIALIIGDGWVILLAYRLISKQTIIRAGGMVGQRERRLAQ